MKRAVDVAVLGGGPAGLAAAIRLVRGGISTVVLARKRNPGPRVGETLGPEVFQILQSLDAVQGLETVPSIPFVGTRSAWGSPDIHERSAILNPLGEGLHVDRAGFDAWLTEKAAQAGVEMGTVSARLEIQRSGDRWRIGCPEADVSARYLIDARGRGTSSTTPERRWIALDRLIGLAGWLEPGEVAATEPEMLIEAAPNGWWYSAPQPDGNLVAIFMTDADLLPKSTGTGLNAGWRSALMEAPLTTERVSAFNPPSRLSVHRAESGYSWPDRGENWFAAGDAAFACDPLAGRGIANALRSGTEVAEEISGESCRQASRAGDAAPTQPALKESLSKYWSERALYYGMEERWPASLFWARRRPMDIANVSIWLHPEATLSRASKAISPEALAPVEALLPPRAIPELLGALRTPAPAHAVLEELKRIAGPLDDIRLLAGVQLLLRLGAIEVGGRA